MKGIKIRPATLTVEESKRINKGSERSNSNPEKADGANIVHVKKVKQQRDIESTWRWNWCDSHLLGLLSTNWWRQYVRAKRRLHFVVLSTRHAWNERTPRACRSDWPQPRRNRRAHPWMQPKSSVWRADNGGEEAALLVVAMSIPLHD
ncbi:hypothetical protein N7513_004376 [Penicillium frequentans]|nr:hypothetical protein N7513_004376 [Penicillium glabrum]